MLQNLAKQPYSSQALALSATIFICQRHLIPNFVDNWECFVDTQPGCSVLSASTLQLIVARGESAGLLKD